MMILSVDHLSLNNLGRWYDDAEFQAFIFTCELFGHILFLYSMKSILDLCKSLFDAEFIYNLSSLANFNNLYLLRYYWSNLSIIHVLSPHVMLFLLLIVFIFFRVLFKRSIYHKYFSIHISCTKKTSLLG